MISDMMTMRHTEKEYSLYEYNSTTGTYTSQVFPNWTNLLRRENYTKQQVLAHVMLNYDRTFNQKHHVGGLIGWEVQKRDGDNFYAYGDLGYSSLILLP